MLPNANSSTSTTDTLIDGVPDGYRAGAHCFPGALALDADAKLVELSGELLRRNSRTAVDLGRSRLDEMCSQQANL